MKGASILLAEMIPDADWEARFNKWYDTHHIPTRMSAPGFVSAQRYRDPERSNYLAVYELAATTALATPEYTRIRTQPNVETKWIQANVQAPTRYVGDEIADLRRPDLTGEPLDAPILYAVFFSVPDERVADFDAWYQGEHVPLLLACRDWWMCRRFLIVDADPQPWTHLALHYIGDEKAFDSPERAAARSTPLRARLAAEPWFNASTVVFHRHGRRFKGRG
ncbi:MAG: hypothetical protein FJX67_09375 [Alphaproteobacteria bacterium]|nr:hypothetical protein [Alphaproteobacteria bacterium]